MLEKKLEPEAADRIGKYVQLTGEPKNSWLSFTYSEFTTSPQIQTGLRELNEIFGYLELMNCLNWVTLDLSLAQGSIIIQTGIIYEAVTLDKSVGVGSIAAGGRYDKLVGMFTEGQDIPAVGFQLASSVL